MKKFVVERILPGAGNLTPEELQLISRTSCDVINQMNEQFYWIQSFVTDDKIYCIQIAESKEIVREHARRSNFPINSISEVKAVIDPLTGCKING